MIMFLGKFSLIILSINGAKNNSSFIYGNKGGGGHVVHRVCSVQGPCGEGCYHW